MYAKIVPATPKSRQPRSAIVAALSHCRKKKKLKLNK